MSTMDGALRRRLGPLALALLIIGACGDGSTGPVENPDLAPFVGTWRATALIVTSKANPEVSPDVVKELGVEFTLNVQPSGQYTAILTFRQQAGTEIGFMSVSGNVVTLERTFPSPQTSTASYTLQGDVLTLVGDSEFDLNQDGTDEEVTARFVLVRQ